jgi:DNA polymerase-1
MREPELSEDKKNDKPTFLLIDGHAVIYRAFFGFPGLTNSAGQLANAAFGFSRILLTAIRDYEPEYIAVAFDNRAPTFRHKDFAAYKANRAEMPDELKPQIEMVKDVVKALNIPQFEIPGYEADDIIGTISRILDLPENKKKVMTVIVTGDRDTFQLVDTNTHVWLPARNKDQSATEYDAAGVEAKMGVPPSQIIDLKALMGDSSDNIPGVKGIGPKTAVTLIREFGSLAGLYEALEKNTTAAQKLSPKIAEKLRTEKEQALMSQSLATIDRAVPLDFSLEDCKVCDYEKSVITDLFNSWGFKSLISSLPADAFQTSVQAALF